MVINYNQATNGRTMHLVGPGKLFIKSKVLTFQRADTAPFRLNWPTLSKLHLYGDISLTGAAINALFRNRVITVFGSSGGHQYRGHLMSLATETTLLRRWQHFAESDSVMKLKIAKNFVQSKISSELKTARHYQRHGIPIASDLITNHTIRLDRIVRVTSLGQLRGFEGAATAEWFSLMRTILRPPFEFRSRIRRPPPDPVNSMLSLTSTWLLQKAATAILDRGLELNVGFLHEYRPGRPSLACDLMEPLRCEFSEQWTMGLLNQSKLNLADFQLIGHRCTMTGKTFPRVLFWWEKEWREREGQRRLDTSLDELEQMLRLFGNSPNAPQGGGNEGPLGNPIESQEVQRAPEESTFRIKYC